MYKVRCCIEIYEKHIDELRFYPGIDTELEVKYTNQSDQNLSLHSIPHSIEPDQSNQMFISPSSSNTLYPTSTSLLQSPDNPVPIEPNLNT